MFYFVLVLSTINEESLMCFFAVAVVGNNKGGMCRTALVEDYIAFGPRMPPKFISSCPAC